jgi:hypothetical protein
MTVFSAGSGPKKRGRGFFFSRAPPAHHGLPLGSSQPHPTRFAGRVKSADSERLVHGSGGPTCLAARICERGLHDVPALADASG